MPLRNADKYRGWSTLRSQEEVDACENLNDVDVLDNLNGTRTSGPWYPPQLSDQNFEVREKTFRETKYFLQTKVCRVRVTVDLPTFCLVTIFSFESEELELELEQPKKSPSNKK